jgi:hypothetical protein
MCYGSHSIARTSPYSRIMCELTTLPARRSRPPPGPFLFPLVGVRPVAMVRFSFFLRVAAAAAFRLLGTGFPVRL